MLPRVSGEAESEIVPYPQVSKCNMHTVGNIKKTQILHPQIPPSFNPAQLPANRLFIPTLKMNRTKKLHPKTNSNTENEIQR